MTTATDWESHWRRYAAATRLNPGQHYRRRLIATLLREAGVSEQSSVFDAGCGSGDLLEAVADTFPGARLGGVDRSASGIDIARRMLPQAILEEATLAESDETLARFRQWATHVICSEVLEHVEDPTPVLQALRSCLVPGGTLIVTVPGGPRTAFDRAIGHLRHYTRQTAAEMVAAAGFENVHAIAAGFPLFNAYRTVVLMRGDKLADDVAVGPGPLARTVMAGFRGLMPLNLRSSPWGWQIAVTATAP